MQTILYQNAFSYGGIHAVYDEYLTLIIFSSDPGTLAGAGQFTGDGDYDDGLTRGDCLLISVFKDSGRYQAGGGESVTFDQLFVEFSVTDGDSVRIFVVAEADVQRQDGDILPGVVHIRCGVCDKTYFFHDNIPILYYYSLSVKCFFLLIFFVDARKGTQQGTVPDYGRSSPGNRRDSPAVPLSCRLRREPVQSRSGNRFF